MAKLIKAYSNDFTIVDNLIFKDRRLSYKELGLLCQMLSLPDNWNFSVAGLSAIHKDGTESIKAGIKKLEEYGYLTRKQAREEKGSFAGYDYLIYQNPAENRDYSPLAENPSTGNPPTVFPSSDNPPAENPPMDNPSTDNPPQYSTKESSTDESSMKESSIYESDSNEHLPVYSREEATEWTDDEFYDHLTEKEYEVFSNLLDASIKGEISSNKSSLIEYFKKMIAKGWVDSYNRPIRNIEGYVRMNFGLYSENQKKRRKTE